MAENKYSWYYRQIDENEKNIQKNLVHVANNEPKEKPKFIVPDSERYLNNIRVCKIPDIYGNFKINSENDFVITFQHLYTMQSSEEAGFYTANSKWVHYHSLGKNLLYDLPQLLENPEIILSSSSQEEQSYSNSDNTTLACVLKENVTLSIDGKEEDCPVVAMIKPNITDDKATIILTAYPKQDFERFLQKGIEQNRLLYLKNEEVLRRDYPIVETNRVATVSFNGLLYTNNIAQFKENVNLLRVENNGMALQTIPDEEKTIKVCNAAKRENPAAVMFFTERQRSVKLYTEVFETLDKTAIQNIPETYFINSLKNYLHKSMPKKYNNQPKMAFSAINKRITNTQKELIKQTIRTEYDIYDDSEEITDYLIISEFKDWAENQSPLIQNQNMPAQEGNKMKEFNYYGITLNIQDNENGTVDIVEPAFNTNISTEQKQETAISYVQSLDEKARRSELCKNAKSKNYIPEIIRKIIEKGAEVINEKINKPLISFVEKHKEEIISSTKKGLAIAAVLGASLAASPELFASTSSEIQTENKNVIEYQYSTPFYRSYDDLENKITVFERYSDGEWEKSGFTTLTDYEIELLYGNQNEQKEESAAAEVDNTEEEVTEQNITPDPEPNETADEDKNSEEFVNEEIPVVDNSVENISQAGSSLESENAGQTENQPKLSDTNQKIEINSESQIKEENLMSETIKNMQGTVKESMNTENNDSEPIKAPDNSSDKLTPFEYLMQKINGSQIKVHLSKKEMQAILTAGKDVQKMAVSYGTNQKIENEQGFLGYGTYVVSVNEENAKQLGIKIASRKYGGTFYINNRPLSEFLQEQNFSPYWNKLLEQFKTTSVDELAAQILRTDVKGNTILASEQNKLSTVLGLGLVEYKREQTFLYSVNIPDNDNTNYLFYDKAIGLEHAIKINEQLEKLGVNWRVSRNDSGKDVYFNVLSQKVFNNNQKQASEFLKSIGYVGMEMSGNNYIVFNDKDMSITNRVQYYKDTNGEVFGFAYEGEIYADEELVNSNVIAHEYTHIWDGYVKNNNPELWQRGKNILKGTSLWQEVAEDKNYENLKTDDEILSECHSRIVGKMAEQVLKKIAQRDGGLTRDQVIDWDKEVSEYIINELKIKPELGEENSVSESEKAEYLKEFLSQTMKDLMNEVKMGQINKKSSKPDMQIGKSSISGNKPSFPEEPQLSVGSRANRIILQTSKERQDIIKKLDKIKTDRIESREFLIKIKEAFKFEEIEASDYVSNRINNSRFALRISNHSVNAKFVPDKYIETSLVIRLSYNEFKESPDKYVAEFEYTPEMLTPEKKQDIIENLKTWTLTGQYPEKTIKANYSPSKKEWENANAKMINHISKIQKMAEPTQGENSMKFPHEDLEHYTFGSGKTIKEYSDEEIARILRTSGSESMKHLGYATEEEIKVLEAIENNEHFSNAEKAVEIDNAERYIASRHIAENASEIIKQNKVKGTTTQIYNLNTNNINIIKDWEWNVPENLIPEELKSKNKEKTSTFSQAKEFVPSTGEEEVKMENIHNSSFQKMISIEQNTNAEFYNSVEDYLKYKKAPTYNEFEIPNTPEILQFAGIENHKILMTTKVLNKAISNKDSDHQLTDEEIISALKGLSDPIAIFESDKKNSEANSNSVLIFTEVVNKNNKPIVVGFEIDANQKGKNNSATINQIHSIHSRSSIINSKNENMFQKWTSAGLLKYVNDKKIQTWLKDRRIQFPLSLTRSDEITITDLNGIVKSFPIKSKTGFEMNFETIQKMAEPTQGEKSIEDSIVDKGIESVQANGGLSEAAMEADIAAIDNQRADYLDEDGNPHFYDEHEPAQEELPYFYDTNDNPHTTSEVYEVLEKFSNLEPEKWNLSPEDKVAVSHLIDVSQIKEVDKDKAFENLSNYLLSEEYKREESNYAKVLTPVLLSYNQEQNNFDFTFSTDEMQKQQSETSVQQKSEITKGEIKSILGNTFTGENVKLTEEFQDKLIKKGLVNPGDEFILLNELEAHAKGTKIKEDQPYVILTTPVQVNGKTQFAATKYYHISAVEEPLKITETAEQKPNETDMDKIIFGKTKVAEFSMHTNHGFEVFENMVVDSHEESTNSYLLKSSDGKNQVRVEAETLKELMSEPYQKKAMSYDEETKIQEKMIESQYKSFFEPRDNFANNFRHNLALYCRKEANSPLDALKIANSLIKQMPDEERNKTKQLLKKLCNKGQTINEVIIETYNTAVKDVPLNENYLNNKRYEKMIQRPMYDTCTAKGEKVDNNFDLKIGDNVKVKFKAGKVFGKGKEKVLSEVKIVSSSKEGNCVTLMDGNKSFYDVPRDTFLKDYGKQLVKEHQMTKKQFAKHSMKLDTGRER